MKILHLSKSPLADAPIRLSNFLSKNGLDSKCIQFQKSVMEVPNDINWDKKENLEQLDDLLDWSDIVHIHNQPPLNNSSSGWDLLKSYSKKKKFVYQVHGEPNKVIPKMYDNITKWIEFDRVLCIAQYQSIFIGNFITRPYTPVRNIIDINDKYFKPKKTKNKIPIVTYSPSNKERLEVLKRKRGSEWSYKSYYEVMPVLESLNKKNIIDYKVFYHQNFLETMKERQKADIHIDDIHTGSYHLSSLEGLSQGKMVICNLKSWMTEFLILFLACGDNELPWVISDSENLWRTIMRYTVKEKEQLEVIKYNSRKFMEKYWNSRLVLNDYLKVYEKLI
ncbi:MAG: hypothetical protein ACOC3V_00140 [bacterium]